MLKPETADKSDNVDGQQDGGGSGSIFVGWVENIPEDHIVFPALPDNAEEWDLVQSVNFGFELANGKYHLYAIPDCPPQMIIKRVSKYLSMTPLLVFLYRELLVSLLGRRHASNPMTFYLAGTCSNIHQKYSANICSFGWRR
jgi:hypothetical protein